MNKIAIKNCGMQTAESISAAIDSGADYIGFIHYPKSARYIEPARTAELTKAVKSPVKWVAVMVQPADDDIIAVKQLGYADYIQLHNDERPERVLAIKELAGLPVIKAIGVANSRDLVEIPIYEAVADYILLDRKSPDYGGTGTAFDWSLLQEIKPNKPWFLSGGLNVGNVASALKQTHAPMLDVSSGIERQKGVKDIQKIRKFNEAVRAYETEYSS